MSLSLSHPQSHPRSSHIQLEPFPQQLKRRIRIIIVEQQLPPPKIPEPFLDPHPELPLQQNKRIRIKKIQLLPPKMLEPHPQPQFDKSPIYEPPNKFYNNIIRP